MQKMIAVLAILVVMLTGCPVTAPITEPVNDNSSVPVGMGRLTISGDFNEAKALMDWNDIVEFQKPRIRRLAFDFFDTSMIGKGGGGMEYHHSIDVINGVYSGSILVPASQYNLYVVAYDELDSQVFVYNTSVTVVASQSRPLEVVLGLTDYYMFQFTVSDLPGEYSDYGFANLVVNGDSYYCQYSRVYPYWDSSDYVIVFYANLPIDFDGRIDESAVIITALDGTDYATELQFSIFDVDVLREADNWYMNVPYLFPEWLGRLNIDISFQQY